LTKPIVVEGKEVEIKYRVMKKKTGSDEKKEKKEKKDRSEKKDKSGKKKSEKKPKRRNKGENPKL
jgi:hypothetical protein